MKIGDSNPIQSTGATRKAAAKAGVTGGADFASLLESAGQAESVGVAAGVETLTGAGLLGFQEVSDEDVRRQKEIRRGNDMLDSLEQLRGGLLMGTLSPEVMREMEGRLKLQRQHSADPKLNALMDDIELRLAVELAKIERAQQMLGEDFA